MVKRKLENNEMAAFGSGCFWHSQRAFDSLKGVIKTEVGYMGGDEENYPSPSYKQVCSGKTGYIEVVNIEFNPGIVSYKELLKKFWSIHDPTQVGRQGPDVGEEYKSVIFYYNEKQKELAEKSKQAEQKNHKKPIVTEILQAKTFFKAEEYHQKYLDKKGLDVCPV